MKYYIANADLDLQITEIKRKIRLSMNGVVSDKMSQNGIFYKKNYGVDIPRLKEIAKTYTQNHDLAQRLWELQIRETMIMATLLEPIDKFTEKIAHKWVKTFNQIEIIEQTCMNLFRKLPYATSLTQKWIQSENAWIQITACILAARITDKFNQNETIEMAHRTLALSATNNLHLYKAIALCLSHFCRKDKHVTTYILKEIETFSISSLISEQYIFNEVKQEILFLDIL